MKKANGKLGIVLLALMMLCVSCLNLRPQKTVTREPSAPGESTLEYQVPPPAKLSILSVGQALISWRGIVPGVHKVTDGVYVARGYAIANVGLVVTKDGLVVIDSTESPEAAKEILKEFKKISNQPIRYLIYTHGHGDHTQGSTEFNEPGIQVIATKQFQDFVRFETEITGPYTRRARFFQMGSAAPEYIRAKLPVKPGDMVRSGVGTPEMLKPTILFDGHYEFELGGEKFELYYAPGETPDTLIIWMPKKRVLFCADDYYASFPNLSSPMLGPRPVAGWIDSLSKMIELKPAFLVPGHSQEVIGEKEVMERLTNYRDAVKSIYDQTIACINEGKTVEQAVQDVKLPEKFAQYDYLKEYYGRVDWSVRGIYQGAIGWYDGNGVNLIPLPKSYSSRELVKLAGGADKILARAIELQKNNEDQLAIELCEVVLQANPEDKTAHLIKAVSLEKMAMNATSINQFGFYLSSSAKEFQAAGYKQ